MNTEQFAYWLQGCSEISEGKTPSENEWKIIQDHLKLVFFKKTPDRTITINPTIDYSKITCEIDKPFFGMVTC